MFDRSQESEGYAAGNKHIRHKGTKKHRNLMEIDFPCSSNQPTTRILRISYLRYAPGILKLGYVWHHGSGKLT